MSDQRAPDASQLPPGMVLLPDGHRMTAADFFRLHGAELQAYPDAQIAVAVPAYEPSQEMRDALKGFVGAATAVLVAAIIKNGTAAKMAGGFIGGYVGTDVASWIAHELAHGASVKIITARQILRGY